MNWEKDLIEYRCQKAAETIEAARFLFEKNLLFSTVNRIYYALFYEVSALLMTKNRVLSVTLRDKSMVTMLKSFF